MDCSTPGFRVLHYLTEFAQTHVHCVGDAIQPSHSLSSPSPAFNLSQHQGLFKWVRWPKCGRFSFNINPSNEYSGLISFRMDRLDLLAVQKLSRVFSNTTVQKHQFFSTQFCLSSNSHIHTWLLEKTKALTRRTFVGKVMSLLFNMLSRLVITFLPRSKRLLILWLQSPSAVMQWFWRPKK